MIRSELDVLLDKVKDPALRADLRSQIDRLKQRRSFGLVFEQHIPERVRLPQQPIRVGSRVVSRDDDDSPTFEVVLIDHGVATLAHVRGADGAYLERGEHAVDGQERAPLDSLVVISDFGEPVLPGFRHLGSIERGADKPYHVVIKGENHHALQALRFTHAGKIDCIYIDPPYNSGARDWKYNNDYVDANDAYRHSKWLAFLERRLKLAKELLNPDDSVLIATIDEREHLRLGLLLEQMFPAARIQMVSSVVSSQASVRDDAFARCNEFLFFVMAGDASPSKSSDDMLNEGLSSAKSQLWFQYVRTGKGNLRKDRRGMFFPILADPASGRIVEVGESIGLDVDRSEVPVPGGLIALWPETSDGSEGRWRTGPEVARARAQKGLLRLARSGRKSSGWSAMTVNAGTEQRINSGEIAVDGQDATGGAILREVVGSDLRNPKTVWNRTSHNAGWHGSKLLASFLPGRTFPYPKSLYAVEDTIRFFVADKPDAVVLDFFSGSGTTAHAVARLNRQDAGRRQSIMVTNNEVSVEEAAELRKRGLRPGDPEWEALGIFEHITRPRVTAAITGETPAGEPIKGDYTFTDKFPMAEGFDENVAFLELRYPDADDIDLGLAFADFAPLLWLRGGGRSQIAERVEANGQPVPYVWTDHYGVLFDEDRWRGFVSDRPASARTAFIVTYSQTAFAGIVAELPTGMDTVRLPDTYLSMFLLDRGRA